MYTNCFEYNLSTRDIQAQAEFLQEFHARYAQHFHSKTKDVSLQAHEYLKGQLLTEQRRNMTKMARQTSDVNEQSLSHFVSKSPWDDEKLLTDIRKEAPQLVGTAGRRALLVDESSFAKQGDKSVGVARQYCGSKGKVDNCQVGVFLAYTDGEHRLLVDKRLYLPRAWTRDRDRCRKAGIPEDKIRFRTKAQLALEMAVNAKENALPFDFIGMDAHYGEQPCLLRSFELKNMEYFADIPCQTRVYLDMPTVGVPPKKGNRGKTPTKRKVLQGRATKVEMLLISERVHFQRMKIRDTQRGELWVDFAAIRVYRIQNRLPVETPVWLLIRKDLDSNEVKYTFSNARPDEPVQSLCEKQSLRYWVERGFEDAKGDCGLDEYQVTSWRAWHHHMAMSMLALLFLSLLRQRFSHNAPMVSLQDARLLLGTLMPRKTLSLPQAVREIRKRHLNRFRSRASALKKQREQLLQNHALR